MGQGQDAWEGLGMWANREVGSEAGRQHTGRVGVSMGRGIRSEQHVHTVWGAAHGWGMGMTAACVHGRGVIGWGGQVAWSWGSVVMGVGWAGGIVVGQCGCGGQ